METTTIQAHSEQRQIAKVMTFLPHLAPYIRWDGIAQEARELGSHFEARYSNDGACTITLFWSYSEDEV